MRFLSPRARLLTALCLSLAALACGDGDGDKRHGNVCDDSSQTIPFELGVALTSTSEAFTLTISDATPSPVDRGDNTWTIQLLNAGGDAVNDATVILEPVMPGHGHGTFPTTFTAKSVDNNGHYTLGPFDLLMPGTWLMTFTVTTPGGASAVFDAGYCIES